MLLKIICLISLIYAAFAQVVELNETKAFLSISSQLTEIRAELQNLGKLSRNPLQLTHSNHKKYYGSNCDEAIAVTHKSGIYEIVVPSYSEHPFEVACDATTQGGGWTIILRRMDGSVNFYRNWDTYKKGFGDLDGEFFLVLDKIHALTAKYSQELLIVLADFEGVQKFEKYEKFAIGDENEKYALQTLGAASGTAGDCLSYHHTIAFSTFDRNNGGNNVHGAEKYSGAWWYNKGGHHSNLAAKYNSTHYSGVYWGCFHNRDYSLKTAVMMIRPRNKH